VVSIEPSQRESISCLIESESLIYQLNHWPQPTTTGLNVPAYLSAPINLPISDKTETVDDESEGNIITLREIGQSSQPHQSSKQH